MSEQPKAFTMPELEAVRELVRKWKEASSLMPNSPSGVVMIAALTTCADELAALLPELKAAWEKRA